METQIVGLPLSIGNGDGTTTQFGIGLPGQDILVANVASVFRSDWQGNQKVYPTPRTNLLFNSTGDTASGQWTLGPNCTRVGNVIGPDGSGTAVAYTCVTVGDCFISQSIYLAQNQTCTFSVWAKIVSLNGGTLTGEFLNVDNQYYLPFGSAGLTTSWQLFTSTFTPTLSGTYGSAVPLYLANDWGAGITIALFGAQMEVGSTVTPLIHCVNNPVTVTDYQVSTQAPVTNLMPYANILNNVQAWGYSQCAATASTIVTDDGTQDAWTITNSTINFTNGYIVYELTDNLAGQTVTFSVSIKQGTLTVPIELWIRDGADTNVAYAIFTPASNSISGSVGSNPPSIYNLGNGCFRLAITATFPASATPGVHLYIDPADTSANAGEYYYAWKAQLEYGNGPSAWIATTLAPVTNLGNASTVGTGQIIFSTAPVNGAAITWTGSYVYSYVAPVVPIWQQTIMSQYANSPILVQLIENFESYIDPSTNINNFYNWVFNINTAMGYGLDLWGRILGVNRVLAVSGNEYFGFTGTGGPINSSGDSFGGGPAPTGASPFYSGQQTTSNFALTDSSFRTLLFAKALYNISNGSMQSINQILINLFIASVPGRTGNAYCTDGQNMTMTYTFDVRPVLTTVEVAIVAQSGVLPKPTGVTASVVQM